MQMPVAVFYAWGSLAAFILIVILIVIIHRSTDTTARPKPYVANLSP